MDPVSRDLIVRTVYGEAAGEPPEGQAAVASVILNRLASKRHGGNVADVVFQRRAFEPWSTRSGELAGLDPQSPAYRRIAHVVDGVISGETPDPTSGATHFWSPSVQAALGRRPPKWSTGEPLAQIGGHLFLAPEGRVVPEGIKAIDKATGPGRMAQAAPASDDLLGSWVKAVAPPSAAPAAAPTGRVEITRRVPAPAAGEPPAGDDLLAAWAKGTPAKDAPAKPPAAPAAASSVSAIGADIAETVGAKGEGWGDTAKRFAGGAARGVLDVVDTGAQGLDWAVRKATNALQSAGLASPETVQAAVERGNRLQAKVAADRTAYEGAAGDSTAALAGRITGNVVATAPAGGIVGGGLRAAPLVGTAMAARPILVGAPAIGAATGGVSAGLTSAASDAPVGEQIMTGTGVGAVAGPVGASVVRGAGRMFGSAVDAATARLAQTARNRYGIDITAGQLSENPMVRFMDSVLQRLPFTGYGARTSQQQGAFNRAISQTFGEDVERITPDVMRQARTRIGQVFDDVANRTGPIRADRRFENALTGIVRDARDVLEEQQARPLINQIVSIAQKVDPRTNTLSPEAYQAITRRGAPLDRLAQSRDPNLRHYAGQIREALDDVMHRSAPADVAADLARARAQWRALKTVEPLARKSTTGNISPANLLAAAGKSYPRGGGDLNELGRIGRRFIAEPPSSGTSERLAVMNMLMPGIVGMTGAGALGAATAFDPDSWQRNLVLAGGSLAATLGASSLLRSQMLTNALIRRGMGAPGSGMAGNAFQRLLPPTSAVTERELDRRRLIAAP